MVAYTQLKVTSTWDFRACLSVLNLCISYSQEEGKKKKNHSGCQPISGILEGLMKRTGVRGLK